MNCDVKAGDINSIRPGHTPTELLETPPRRSNDEISKPGSDACFFTIQAATIEFVQTNYEASRLDLSSIILPPKITPFVCLGPPAKLPGGGGAGLCSDSLSTAPLGDRRPCPQVILSSRLPPQAHPYSTPLCHSDNTSEPGLSLVALTSSRVLRCIPAA